MSILEPGEVGPDAAGWPGLAPRWTSSAKSGVGTSLDRGSRVWFTVSHGIVDEVYYPRIDQANTRDLGLLIAGPDGYFAEEKRDADSRVRWLADGVPGFVLTNVARDGRWRVRKLVFTHPTHDVLLQDVRIEWLDPAVPPPAWRAFALLAPHIDNRGAGNEAWVGEDRGVEVLLARRGGTSLALGCSTGWRDATAGFVGSSDGWQDVRANGRLTTGARRALDGNVALCGEVAGPSRFVLALGFGRTPAEAALRVRLALNDDVREARRAFVRQWRGFQSRGASLVLPADGAGHVPSLVRTSVAVLRAHEDRGVPGGLIASLSIPWGQSKGDEDLGGYHLVWPRDLVECAGALLAAGHFRTARRTLRFLMATQEADGHWPQNCWLDGTPYWNGIQMDETAFPILLADLAWREGALRRPDGSACLDVWPMVRRAAAYLVAHGPVTAQDRWEEDAGYSPFTLAAEVAALLAAADIADRAADHGAAAFLRDVADAWNESIERWTFVTDTPLSRELGVAGYYARIAPPEIADAASPTGPDAGWVPIKNRADPSLRVPYATLVSPDALALVRFGLRHPLDPRILDTIRVIDATLRSETPTGPVWRRYTGDGYGEHEDGRPFDGTGVGRGWPLLAGERAHWAIAARDLPEALRLLDVMARQASDGGMLPEQVWDAADVPERELVHGRPTGGAMPLAWTHAEYLKLARSLHDGRVFDLPPQAAARYVDDTTPGRPVRRAAVAFWASHQRIRSIRAGQDLRVLLPSATSVTWIVDGVEHVSSTHSPLPGIHVAELATGGLAPGVVVAFRCPATSAGTQGSGTIVVDRD